jgi:hypothetical protein
LFLEPLADELPWDFVELELDFEPDFELDFELAILSP